MTNGVGWRRVLLLLASGAMMTFIGGCLSTVLQRIVISAAVDQIRSAWPA